MKNLIQKVVVLSFLSLFISNMYGQVDIPDPPDKEDDFTMVRAESEFLNTIEVLTHDGQFVGKFQLNQGQPISDVLHNLPKGSYRIQKKNQVIQFQKH